MLVPERQIHAFSGPKHSFLAAGELFGCENIKLTDAGIHLEGENSCLYFLCIFFLRSGCSQEPNISADWRQESWGQIPCWILHTALPRLFILDLSTEAQLCLWSLCLFSATSDITSGAPCQKTSLLSTNPYHHEERYSSLHLSANNNSCNLLCFHRSAWARTASPSPGQLKRCKWQRKVAEIPQLDMVKARQESWSAKMKVVCVWPPWRTLLWEDLQALGTDSTLLPLSLWDCSPCRSRALPLWSVSIFLTDEFAHYICEAICGSVGTAPGSPPLQCVVLLLAHRNIRLLSLTLTSISLLGPFLNRWRLE